MIRLRFGLIALSLSALSACASPVLPQENTGGPLPPSPTVCVADPAQWAVGQQATADVIERVRHNSHSRVTRVIRPGEMITMYFSTERVDIRVDSGNAILQVRCG